MTIPRLPRKLACRGNGVAFSYIASSLIAVYFAFGEQPVLDLPAWLKAAILRPVVRGNGDPSVTRALVDLLVLLDSTHLGVAITLGSSRARAGHSCIHCRRDSFFRSLS